MHLAFRPLSALAAGLILAAAAPAAPALATPEPPRDLVLTTAAPATATRPAGSAPRRVTPVRMVLNASATTVNRGAVVTFSGRVWQAPTGNQAPVYFYFQKRGTTAWTAAGSVRANSRGQYTKTVRATTTGTWKAAYRGTATRAATARGRLVNVLGTVPRQIAAYSNPATNWQSPRLKISTVDYRAVATYRCANTGHLFLTWNGDNFGYESANSSQASGTVTLNGHRGARSGYFDVSTWLDCTWSLKVYAGTVRVLV
ncbi:hypothetical protein [Actinoplanes sp. GCM10030250]|uniref:hypothetical protein n=1 Tax=Actinoplanes sp. GCM10030250 TaxID=3273376 RepID=UPI00361D99A1